MTFCPDDAPPVYHSCGLSSAPSSFSSASFMSFSVRGALLVLSPPIFCVLFVCVLRRDLKRKMLDFFLKIDYLY